MNDISNSLLFNTKNISNTMYSFIVRIFIILISNPQITKAQSEKLKSKLIIISLLVTLEIIYLGLRLNAKVEDVIGYGPAPSPLPCPPIFNPVPYRDDDYDDESLESLLDILNKGRNIMAYGYDNHYDHYSENFKSKIIINF